MTTSKKDPATRANELFKIAQKPLEIFFEEKLQYYLQDIKDQPVLKALCLAICYYGCAMDSDFVDELTRQLQKPLQNSTDKCKAIGDANIHRLIREMVKAENAGHSEAERPLDFSKKVASILMKDFEHTLSTRAVFILIELIENKATNGLVMKQVLAYKPEIQAMHKKEPKSAGVNILMKKLD